MKWVRPVLRCMRDIFELIGAGWIPSAPPPPPPFRPPQDLHIYLHFAPSTQDPREL
jgi:hypothetical protein